MKHAMTISPPSQRSYEQMDNHQLQMLNMLKAHASLTFGVNAFGYLSGGGATNFRKGGGLAWGGGGVADKYRARPAPVHPATSAWTGVPPRARQFLAKMSTMGPKVDK
eukprot:CAMPEP_0174302172 /NCGR_PEP_ID=MMETSP0809-20121228/59477_1 /TAXON_ID=73025 ORGANISM="Eutreptiella gymnastica-like, Strain CCMP1594" /NCGR_SAMPLE_ID=MMETSP0809 /ASSEMBLY_ACC=CAM_ASM_000658 /LENGTH=107 /DNA_ID=CAMNT_0015408049 /DNA_START=765 /DNA_END=1089 /DNA_ORIENTATION=-